MVFDVYIFSEADIFQINSPTLTNATVLYGHNDIITSISDDRIDGVYVGQSSLVNYNWEIDSSGTGKINTALFNLIVGCSAVKGVSGC